MIVALMGHSGTNQTLDYPHNSTEAERDAEDQFDILLGA